MVTLDIGCGSNKFNKRAIGVDVVKSEGVDVVADVIDLHMYSSDSIDIVFCRRTITHVEDDHTAIREIARILNSSGLAVIEVGSWWNGIIYSLKYCRGKDRYLWHFYTPIKFKRLLEKNGLKVIQLGTIWTWRPWRMFRNYVAVCIKGETV